MKKNMHKHKGALIAFAHGEKIEVSSGYGEWAPTSKPSFEEHLEYRVAPERVFPVTSLSGEHLHNMWSNMPGGVAESFVQLANEVIEQHILDTEQAS